MGDISCPLQEYDLDGFLQAEQTANSPGELVYAALKMRYLDGRAQFGLGTDSPTQLPVKEA
jgi:hypothetical protein